MRALLLVHVLIVAAWALPDVAVPKKMNLIMSKAMMDANDMESDHAHVMQVQNGLTRKKPSKKEFEVDTSLPKELAPIGDRSEHRDEGEGSFMDTEPPVGHAIPGPAPPVDVDMGGEIASERRQEESLSTTVPATPISVEPGNMFYPSEPRLAYPETQDHPSTQQQAYADVDNQFPVRQPEQNHDSFQSASDIMNGGGLSDMDGMVLFNRIPTAVVTPSLIFAIPTMRRRARDGSVAPEKYLTPLVQGILRDLTPEQKAHIKVMLYNVDREPKEHKEVHDLSARFPDHIMVVNKPKKNHVDTSNEESMAKLAKSDGQELELTNRFLNWISGETNDATDLLYQARKLATYVVFLEDDVKPTSSVVTKLSDYMFEMETRGLDDWFMIDLYTPKINWGRNPLYVKNFAPYDYECCTQAMLFRSDRLEKLLEYEAAHSNLPIDDNIRDYAREPGKKNRAVYAIVPNLFEHIGRYSSNPEKSGRDVEHVSINFVP